MVTSFGKVAVVIGQEKKKTEGIASVLSMFGNGAAESGDSQDSGDEHEDDDEGRSESEEDDPDAAL